SGECCASIVTRSISSLITWCGRLAAPCSIYQKDKLRGPAITGPFFQDESMVGWPGRKSPPVSPLVNWCRERKRAFNEEVGGAVVAQPDRAKRRGPLRSPDQPQTCAAHRHSISGSDTR